MRWFLENYVVVWKLMLIRVVWLKEDVVVVINLLVEGRISCEKVVICYFIF